MFTQTVDLLQWHWNVYKQSIDYSDTGMFTNNRLITATSETFFSLQIVEFNDIEDMSAIARFITTTSRICVQPVGLLE